MHCLVVPPESIENPASAALPAATIHHLRDVMRVRAGDEVRLVDGHGASRRVRVAAVSRSGVLFAADASSVMREPQPFPAITLFQCIAKPARMDWLLEKAVETGVARIVPVASSRVVSRFSPGDKPDRWQRILDAALEQCGSAWGTEIAPVESWAGALALMRAFQGPLFVGALTPEATQVGEALSARRSRIEEGMVGWVIGPEGDFSPEELSSVLALPHATAVSFGPRILRVETAALFAVAATAAVLGAHN